MTRNRVVDGGGQMVSVRAIYSDDPSSNSAESIDFYSVKLFEKDGNNEKEAGNGPFQDSEIDRPH